mmetsp:Transcript_16624/g.49649  ORF Transcript_16624/g.49649 Transcript_16624/m.49649 type:complete len:263 (+) Transcript_16624:994-1782(+)
MLEEAREVERVHDREACERRVDVASDGQRTSARQYQQPNRVEPHRQPRRRQLHGHVRHRVDFHERIGHRREVRLATVRADGCHARQRLAEPGVDRRARNGLDALQLPRCRDVEALDRDVQHQQHRDGNCKPLCGDRNCDDVGDQRGDAASKLDERPRERQVHDVSVARKAVEDAALRVGVKEGLWEAQQVAQQAVVEVDRGGNAHKHELERAGEREHAVKDAQRQVHAHVEPAWSHTEVKAVLEPVTDPQVGVHARALLRGK